jgi:hypothetical protein
MPSPGHEAKTSPRRVNVALRRAKALQMRAGGAQYEEIKTTLGYSTRAAAIQDVQRAMTAVVAEPAAEVRALELLRLDQALQRLAENEAKVKAVMDREHITVSHGRVVYVKDETGKEVPLIDDAPVLHANAQLMAIEDRRRHIQDRRAKYLGLDAPAKVQVITDDDLDREIRELTDQLAQLDAGAAGEDSATAGAETPES